ncbi:MAG: septum formation initiator family protein [Bacteriovorax sp.]|nr:septum formation initiator family protein [Bacteriovorax sp.]
MEFSFDRSNGTQSTGPSAKAQTPPQPTQQAQSTPSDDGIDTSTITNERLRKAIEKNRARQAERNRTNPQAAEQQQYTEQASLFDKQQQQTQNDEPAPQVPPLRHRAQERAHAGTPKASTVVTRRSVARPDEAEFIPVKRTPRKVASQISYTTTSRKKSKPLDPTLVGYLVKGCWIFCVVMILRLIFANGGVTDFYSQRSMYSDRLTELDRIKKENMQLVHEIERMQTDTSFQKKLVRDNLGFIAADEFLVLFPKEKSVQ